ncbi:MULTISPECIES: hotdog fold thioesterase [Dyadobacter]|jgi:1,4-dihydroxy-2-naphthoyl-CoA hydrolase|uniref:Hotdog fold thioesterase n=1 Tax=Dyadobacter chenhuakuii TaxID=2909339 RepID=A0ABY4XTG4_9BACT|nr:MULTISPECIES: hotdog fold thioesterase [Dyadobacter]MCE7070002.1 hotdog fold thioesterase [Dyadobacter sp. CY327]MCF2492324.1 hotdog fold thioesterase [Dyadobacter chenhuakuii]MCF2516968.1 hotdog fold thioesterase [Dyadobacter sp. CY351]USJ33371.1 hotdog fold thioesterase [Dyadobacter chenhuakuii]
MFTRSITLDALHSFSQNTISNHLGIEFTEIGNDYITARMPVDKRTHQPFGILHGGASVVLAETLGSIASFLCLPDPDKQHAVGLEINANHIRSARAGFVYGTVRPIHLGRTTHIWDIQITNEERKLVCISRLTVAIVNADR